MSEENNPPNDETLEEIVDPITPETPSEPEEPVEMLPVVAALYVANAKGSRSLKVHGRSGNPYKFKASDRHKGKVVREYTSFSKFEREELDIRQNTGQGYHVCTFLGATDPVLRAKEALQDLIGATNKVASENRVIALREIFNTACSAISAIEEANKQAVADTPPDEPQTVAVPFVEQYEKQPEPVVPEPEATQPEPIAEPTKDTVLYTQPQLMDMHFDLLKRMKPETCKETSRVGIVAAILEAQAK